MDNIERNPVDAIREKRDGLTEKHGYPPTHILMHFETIELLKQASNKHNERIWRIEGRVTICLGMRLEIDNTLAVGDVKMERRPTYAASW